MSTTNLAQLLESGEAGYGLRPYSAIVPNNVTGVVVKAKAGILFDIHGDNNSTVAAYIKVYDKATAPTTSDTPVLRFQIPPSASGPLDKSLRGGFGFANGISYIIATGQADNSTAAPAATTYTISLGYK